MEIVTEINKDKFINEAYPVLSKLCNIAIKTHSCSQAKKLPDTYPICLSGDVTLGDCRKIATLLIGENWGSKITSFATESTT
jgi:hypothetical protein